MHARKIIAAFVAAAALLGSGAAAVAVAAQAGAGTVAADSSPNTMFRG